MAKYMYASYLCDNNTLASRVSKREAKIKGNAKRLHTAMHVLSACIIQYSIKSQSKKIVGEYSGSGPTLHNIQQQTIL